MHPGPSTAESDSTPRFCHPPCTPHLSFVAAQADALKHHVREDLGPIAQPAEVEFVDALPKTRSGKIMRRLFVARSLGLDEGDTSTLED